jgi:hypothetical protein
MPTEEEIDFLEVDRPIPGQNYVCLSFISPEKIIENKNMFTFYKFYLSMNEGSDMTFAQFKDNYEDFQEGNDSVQKEFDEICDFQTNVRGVKIRGVYDTQREANIRAQVLQKMDNAFHVYVGQIGYWLPWDPNPNDIQEQEYLNKDLNRLNKEYNKNQEKKDMFYEEQKREKKMSAIRENEEKKKANANAEALKTVENNDEALNSIDESNELSVEAPAEPAPATEAPTEPASATEVTSAPEGEKTLEETLNEVDPWMQRKMDESNSGN